MSASDDTNDSRPRVLAEVPAPRNIAPEDRLSLIALLRTMMVIRAFEKCLMSLPSPGFQLLSAGEEAVAVGVCAALAPDDPLLCSGRSIGPALARGLNPAAVMAEILGKADGPCRGRGGRSHIAQPAGGFFGAHGVVGGNLSVAAGVALAAHMQRTGRIVVCLFGDGACGAGSSTKLSTSPRSGNCRSFSSAATTSIPCPLLSARP